MEADCNAAADAYICKSKPVISAVNHYLVEIKLLHTQIATDYYYSSSRTRMSLHTANIYLFSGQLTAFILWAAHAASLKSVCSSVVCLLPIYTAHRQAAMLRVSMGCICVWLRSLIEMHGYSLAGREGIYNFSMAWVQTARITVTVIRLASTQKLQRHVEDEVAYICLAARRVRAPHHIRIPSQYGARFSSPWKLVLMRVFDRVALRCNRQAPT